MRPYMINCDSLTGPQGSLLLQVKWKGYDDPADQTMEPEDNLLYVTCHPGRLLAKD